MNKQDQPTGNKGIVPIPFNERIPKRWIEARRKYSHTRQQRDNETIERCFMHLLYQAKKLLKQQHMTAFGRDMRYCNATDAFCMEVFMCSSTYLYLECSFDFKYRVHYAFWHCRYEAEIRKLLDNYMLKGRTVEIQLEPNFQQFYLNVLTLQDSKHIILL